MSTQRRNTLQRKVILMELRKLTSHPTAGELYDIVRLNLPNISLGTVYRNLELLRETGLIQRIEGDGVKSRFDGNPDMHHHIRCISCGRMDDVHELDPGSTSMDYEELGGYEVIGCRLDFIGTCPDCRNRKKNKN